MVEWRSSYTLAIKRAESWPRSPGLPSPGLYFDEHQLSKIASLSACTAKASTSCKRNANSTRAYIYVASVRPSPAWPTILDVIGDLLAYGCEVEQFLLDEGVFGLLGKLPIHGRLLPKIVVPVHDVSGSGRCDIANRSSVVDRLYGSQLAFARDALMRLTHAFYPVFKFTLALRQFFCDFIGAPAPRCGRLRG